MREIREVTAPAELVDLHSKMDIGYPLDLAPDFVIRYGLYDDGKLRAAMLGRITTEAYLLLDKEWANPRIRWESILRLTALATAEAKGQGVRDTHIWLPPKAAHFSHRLEHMGFVKVTWPCMVAKL